MAHRKVVLCLLGATLAASLFSGCSGKKSDPVTVTVWTYYNGDQLDTFKDLEPQKIWNKMSLLQRMVR